MFQVFAHGTQLSSERIANLLLLTCPNLSKIENIKRILRTLDLCDFFIPILFLKPRPGGIKGENVNFLPSALCNIAMNDLIIIEIFIMTTNYILHSIYCNIK